METIKWGVIAAASLVTLVGVGYLVTPAQRVEDRHKATNPVKQKLADIATEITRIADSLRGTAVFTQKQLAQLSEELMQHQLHIDSLQTDKYAHLKKGTYLPLYFDNNVGLTKEIQENFKIIDLKIKEFIS